jgi:hypothetical protein
MVAKLGTAESSPMRLELLKLDGKAIVVVRLFVCKKKKRKVIETFFVVVLR